MSAYNQHLKELIGHFKNIEPNEKKLREKIEVVLCQAYRLKNRSNSSPFVPATRGEWNMLYFNPDLLDKKFELSCDNVYIPLPASTKTSTPTPSSVITAAAGGEGGGGVPPPPIPTPPLPPPIPTPPPPPQTQPLPLPSQPLETEANVRSLIGPAEAAGVTQVGMVSKNIKKIEENLLNQENKVSVQQQHTFSGKGKGRRRRGGN